MEKDFDLVYKYKKIGDEAVANKDINTAMFLFGLLLGFRDGLLRSKLSSIGSFAKELRDDYWQTKELLQVLNGWDNIEEGPNIPRGILFLVNQLEYVVEFNKSKWAYYYLLGNAVGLFNSDEIKNTELHYFINKIPNDFIKNHHKIFEQLINDFILKGIAYKFQTELHYFYPVENK